MTTPESRAATSAAIGALTDFLLEMEAGSPRPVGAYLQQLVDEDGVGALAQGYYGLLNLSALHRARSWRAVQDGGAVTSRVRWAAGISALCWLGVLVAGRMIGFL